MIMAVCRGICKEFSHSPIFRISGDEFIAVLKGNDYMRMDELLLQFEEHMRNKTLEEAPDIPVEMVYGVAQSAGGTIKYSGGQIGRC